MEDSVALLLGGGIDGAGDTNADNINTAQFGDLVEPPWPQTSKILWLSFWEAV